MSGGAESGATGGFTLVELLVVLVILGLLLVATPIAFDRVLPGLEIKSEARDLASVFREARGLAIRDNEEITVNVDVAERTYEHSGGGAEHRFAEGILVTLRTAASERTGDDAGRIRFFPDGTSTGGRVILERRGLTYEVVVDWLYGRVQIAE